jgi:hypothetical protein
MRIVTGIARPTAGSVTVGGHDLATAAGRTAVQRDLGYQPQDLGVYGGGMRYRMVASTPPSPQASRVEPGREGGCPAVAVR